MKLLLVLLSGFASSTSAWAYSAKISYLSGDAEVGTSSHLNKATLGSSVGAGETIKTGRGALAILTFVDGSQVKLNPESILVVGDSKENSEITLLAGGAFAKVEKQKSGHFSLRTKSASMGVRGTRFFTAYGKEGKKGEDVWMCVDEGTVAVETPGEKDPVLVKKGFGVFVPAGKKATEPKPYEWTKGLNWNMDAAKGEVADHTSMDSGYKDLLKQNYD